MEGELESVSKYAMATNLSKAETGGSQRTASMYLDCVILWICEGFWGPEMAIISRF